MVSRGYTPTFLPSGVVEQLSVEEGIQYLKQTKKEISQYLDEMGVPQEFLTLASSINQNKLHLLNTRELKLFLPFAVGEYSAVIPIKVEQALNSQRNLFQKLMVVVIENVGDGAELIDYLMEAERVLLDNFEVSKWATGPEYYIKRGVHIQNFSFSD